MAIDESTTEHHFLNWIKSQRNGAWISNSITIQHFTMYRYGLVAKRNVKMNEPLFRIPSSIIQSSDKFKLQYSAIVPDFKENIETLLGNFSSLERQDILLALHLMNECTQYDTSHYQPYLDMLPKQIIPRLDTFDQHDLFLLEDEFLSNIAQESRSKLQTLYHHVDFQRMMPSRKLRDECTSFSSFHRFVTISSSHSMILNGTKYLVPLADMINHSVRPDITTPHFFSTFHRRNSNGSITVYADRNVVAGDQIFEDYGSLDNSLFLEAHGFVPSENPFHCAIIESRYLLEFSNVSVGLIDILLDLRMIPSRTAFPDVCITAEGHIEDTRLVNLLRILSLGLDDEKLDICTKTKSPKDCVHYDSALENVSRLMEKLAGRAYCAKRSSLDEDLEMLESFQTNIATLQSELALKFKIADKRILSNLSGLGFSHNLCNTTVE
jgi:hypothetical protein